MTDGHGAAAAASVARLLDGYSLEMTARDSAALEEARDTVPAGTRISVTFLPGETMAARVAAAATVRSLGCIPVPHLSARRLTSHDELRAYLEALAAHDACENVFVVGGDLAKPSGPYPHALSIIRSGLLERYGVRHVGIAGYPEGHADIPEAVLDQALGDKQREIKDRGLACSVVTQFGFDAAPICAWLARVRADGIAAPVRIGLPGPASVKTLLRFAARCGVAASGAVMRKYGVSISRLFTTAGPDLLVVDLAACLDPVVHGKVLLHLYPFGGLAQAARWANERRTTGQPARS